MIIFDLSCVNSHRFEGWFRSFDDFERQLADGLITCPACGGHEVRRVPSAVHIGAGDQSAEPETSGRTVPVAAGKETVPPLAIYHQLVRALVSQSEDVGSKFAEEARRIHYLEAPVRSIHGRASDADFEALRDEGIEVWRLPVVKKEGLN